MAEPAGEERDEGAFLLRERLAARLRAGEIQRAVALGAKKDRRPDIALEPEIEIAGVVRDALLPGVIEGRDLIGLERVQAVGSTDIELRARLGRPVRAMHEEAGIGLCLDRTDDAKLEPECRGPQIEQARDLVVKGKVRLDRQQVKLAQGLVKALEGWSVSGHFLGLFL